MRKARAFFLLFFLAQAWVWVLTGNAAVRGPGLLLYRPGDGYLTYSREAYKQWPRSYLVRPEDLVFDELGNFLLEGIEVFRLRESRTLDPEPGSSISKSRYFGDYLSHLSVSSDTYGDFNTSFIVGDNIRTKFTSMTLDLAAMNGIRWDMKLPHAGFTLISSRLDYPIFDVDKNLDDKQHNYGVFGTRPPYAATYLLGSHAETHIGVLNLGAVWVNQYRVDSQLGPSDWDFKGVIPSLGVQPVDYLVVKFADGSVDDGHGARVYDLKVYINGKPHPELRVYPDAASALGVEDTLRIAVTRHHLEHIDPSYPNGDEVFPRELGREIPPYVEFITHALPEEFPGEKGYLEANGKEYLLYWVPLGTQDIQSVEFKAKVANDYRISLSEVYVRDPSRLRKDRSPRDRNKAMYFYDVAYAPGNVQDLSNLQIAEFSYGRQTGRMVGGLHADLKVENFQLRAEYDLSYDFRQYPVLKGPKTDRQGKGYFINGKMDRGRTSFGGELFHIGPRYGTSLQIQDPAYQTMVSLPYAPLVNDITGGLQGIEGFNQSALNGTMTFDMVEDNDDKDRFPDDYFLRGKKDLDGIFPGLDLDQDGRPDINKNNNGIPDYLEPFLLYNINPEEYDYGDDLNNNGVIDLREDDANPDYPYNADLEGYHFFTALHPWRETTFTAGHYRTEQIAAGGRNKVTYGKLGYNSYIPFWGRITFVNFAKRVRDNIRDNVYQYPRNATFELQEDFLSGQLSGGRLNVKLIEDPLRMKDSFVNTTFASLDFAGSAPLNLHLDFKYDFNHQFGTEERKSNRISRATFVVKGEYPWQPPGRFRSIKLTPQMKLMGQKLNDQRWPIPVLHELFFYPILRLDWNLTPLTSIRLGAQGFPFLKSRSLDLVNRDQDFSGEDYVAIVANSFIYQGYQVNFNVGYQVQKRNFDSPRQSLSNTDTAIFFMRALVGLRPVI